MAHSRVVDKDSNRMSKSRAYHSCLISGRFQVQISFGTATVLFHGPGIEEFNNLTSVTQLGLGEEVTGDE
jgi:hypothetical protein